MKRSGKFYRNNEKDVMKKFGLEPTPNSGSGWIVKEDGQSEDIICQLKSTDALSIGIKLKDLKTLEANAATVSKIPMFVIEFLSTCDTYILVRPEDIQDLVLSMDNKYIKQEIIVSQNEPDEPRKNDKKKLKSAFDKRKEFMEENDKKFKTKRRSAL